MRREPILLQEKRFNFLPHRFLHRGVERQVRRVEGTWDVAARWRRPAGRYFRVRCQDDARYDLFHDVALNAWYLQPTRSTGLEMVRSTALGRGKLKWNFT